MSKIWNKMGVVAFWVTWPGIWLYLRNTHRTRALIVCGDEFLALKQWLGSDTWILPGGGMHRSEDAMQGVIREVQEETGIVLTSRQLDFLYSGHRTIGGFRFNYEAFVVVVPEKPVVTKQKWEIIDSTWLPVKNPGQPLAPDVADILTYWQNKK